MQVTLMNRQIFLPNTLDSIKIINGQLEELQKNEELYLDHMVIDGEIIFNNHEDYITESIDEIDNILIRLHNVSEMCKELIFTGAEYLDRMIPQVKELAVNFYKILNEDVWLKFQELIEGISWISKTLDFLKDKEGDMEKVSRLEEIGSTLGHHLKELENALEQMDSVLIADLLTYELIPLLLTLSAFFNDPEGANLD